MWRGGKERERHCDWKEGNFAVKKAVQPLEMASLQEYAPMKLETQMILEQKSLIVIYPGNCDIYYPNNRPTTGVNDCHLLGRLSIGSSRLLPSRFLPGFVLTRC